jgi:hypothetical protein
LDEIGVLSPIHVAAIGDVHGNFGRVAAGMSHWNKTHTRRQISLGLQVGDAEAIRDERDLTSVMGPLRHRKMGEFAAYHTGDKLFPIPTYLIGGNHEAHFHNEQFPTGGVLAPNLFSAGRVFEQRISGLRIAGVSGIYIRETYDVARPDHLPDFAEEGAINFLPWTGFTRAEIDIAKRSFVGAHILMLHDWPAHLLDFLDPYSIRGDVEKAVRLGNEPALELLIASKPDLLICGHHHTFLSGRIFWRTGEVTQVVCLDKIRPQRQVDATSISIIKFTQCGLRVLQPGIPKVRTEKLNTLVNGMEAHQKNFTFIFPSVLQKSQLEAVIGRCLGTSVGDDGTFTFRQFSCRLEFCMVDEDSQADDNIDSGYRLVVTPLGSSRSLNPHEIIEAAQNLWQVFQNEGVNPIIVSAFSDFVG